nr:MAG TPA: hypothetical protein [Caudoviricetes sp.]
MQKASILEAAHGAIMEQVDIEVGKIIANILDPNTSETKKRQLTLTVDFQPLADRTQVSISATAKCKLLPNAPISTTMFVDSDQQTGEMCMVEARPNVPGQMSLSGDVEERPQIFKVL